MSISVNCPQCGAINQVNDSLAGRRVRCPQCDTAVHVPELAGGAPPPLPATSEDAGEPVVVEAVPVEPIAPAPVAQPSPVPTPPVSNDDDDDDDLDGFVRKQRDEDELDMTPMVDVTFLLLIFFMVTAAFSLQKSIKMPKQQTELPSSQEVEQEEEVDTTEIQIDEFGSFLVMAPDWEQETPGKQNLITALKKAIDGSRNGMKLQIKVHEQCKLQFLVDAMDAGTLAGFAPIQVTQVEGF